MKNIVWIQIDSLRPEFLRLDANHGPQLFLDKLVSSGMTYTNCIAAAPYTLASEVSMFTGFYPHLHGVDGWFCTSPSHMKRGIVTFTDVLRSAGYQTMCIYESAKRAYVPPFSFDEYHMLTPGQAWPMTRLRRLKNPRFIFAQFAGVHDDCIQQQGRYTRTEYRRSVERVSDQVERFYNQIGADSDITVVASDHGVRCIDEPEGNHRENVTGQYLTDKTIKVFFSIIDSTPGFKAKIDATMVRGIDVAPTVLNIAGLPSMGAQGTSVLQGDAAPFAISQTGGMHTSPWRPDTWCVRTEHWKFVYTRKKESNQQELYDLRKDPYEINNVLNANPKVAAKLSSVLQAEVFNQTTPQEIYERNGADSAHILSSRRYPLRVRLNVCRKNLLYRFVERTRKRAVIAYAKWF